MTQAHHYDYAIDPKGNSTANKVIRWVGQNQRVLELGTAAGTMTRAMRANGCKITGVEFIPEMATHAAPACERLIIGDLDTLDFKATFDATHFDVIVAADVLEHLREPLQLLQQARKHITPDGHLVISIPNIAHAAVIAGLLRGHFDYREKGLLDQTHLRFFTRKSIETMLLATGWIPIAWESHRVTPLASEFAHHWQNQTASAREIIQQHPDHDIYQFIVKAVPANDLGWQKKLQAQIEQLTADLQQKSNDLDLRTQHHERDLASLREHQQAFTEAKAWIAQLQLEITQQQAQQQAYEEELNQLKQQQTTALTELSKYQHCLISRISTRVCRWLNRNP